MDIWGFLAIGAKLALYLGFLGATGLVIVRLLFEELTRAIRTDLQKQTACLAALGLLGALFSFSLRGAALTGDIGGMSDAEMLSLLWQTPVGDALVYRGAGAMLLLSGLVLGQAGLWISLAGGAAGLWSFGVIGHVPDIDQTGVRLLLFVHLLGVAFWAGILLPLRQLSLDSDSTAVAARLGHRFGRLAVAIVPALIAVGALMAWLLLGSMDALLTTPYGLNLVAKMLLVAALLVLAAANKLRFVPALQGGHSGAGQRLARAIEIEAVIFLLLLAATARLTSTVTLPG